MTSSDYVLNDSAAHVNRSAKQQLTPPSRIQEISGLRGVALTLVVLFHIFGNGRVSGGVDVFLLVSGFLLTRSLVRLLRGDLPLGVVERWGRTFTRLLPPAVMVLTAVLILTYSVFPVSARTQTLAEIVSSTLYVENWQLIDSQLAYGAAGAETSPLQHFWSLSVQGQFFLFFPIIVLLITVAVRSPRKREHMFWTLLALGTLTSFLFAWRYNGLNPEAAYLNTFSRFWELGLGGLVAGAHVSGAFQRVPGATLLGWLGLTTVVTAGFFIDGASAYPGPLALVPTLGAVLVLVSSTSSSRIAVSGLLNSRALGYMDSISYGLYLWHWPVLIAVLAITQKVSGPIAPIAALLVLVLSIGAAILTRWMFDGPGSWALRSGRTRLSLYLVTFLIIGTVPASIGQLQSKPQESLNVKLDVCAGAAALDPELPQCSESASEMVDFFPRVEDLNSDDANRDECWISPSRESGFDLCTIGAESPTIRILAVGDSHNNVYVDVYERIGKDMGWSFDVAGQAGCQWLGLEAQSVEQPPEVLPTCRYWREQVNELVTQGEYDAILTVGSSRKLLIPPANTELEDFEMQMHLEAWSHRDTAKTAIIALRDFPLFGPDQMLCIENKASVLAGDCKLARSEALLISGVEAAVVESDNSYLVDLSDYMCDYSSCSQVVGGVVVARSDGYHLTATFASTLKPYLEKELSLILQGAG